MSYMSANHDSDLVNTVIMNSFFGKGSQFLIFTIENENKEQKVNEE